MLLKQGHRGVTDGEGREGQGGEGGTGGGGEGSAAVQREGLGREAVY